MKLHHIRDTLMSWRQLEHEKRMACDAQIERIDASLQELEGLIDALGGDAEGESSETEKILEKQFSRSSPPPSQPQPGPFDRAGATAGQPADPHKETLDLSSPEEGDAPYFGYSWPRSTTEHWPPPRRQLMHLQESAQDKLDGLAFLPTDAWAQSGLRLDLDQMSAGLCSSQIKPAQELLVKLRILRMGLQLVGVRGAPKLPSERPWCCSIDTLKAWFVDDLGGDPAALERKGGRRG